MPNSIEEIEGVSIDSFVGPTSRYRNSDIINYITENKKFLTFKTWKRPARQSSEGDRFYTITAGTEFRPDIVAKNAYNREGWWWILMLVNNMSDVLEFKAGKTIIIPVPFN